MIASIHVTHSSAGIDGVQNALEVVDAGALDTGLLGNSYVIVKTCNRFEIYVSTDSEDVIHSVALFAYALARRCAVFMLDGEESIRHLFRVSCGLDSLIVGEDQIQGQIKDAYVQAKHETHISAPLGRIFDGALYTGKRVRTETALNSGAVSVGSAAAELADRRMHGIAGKTMLVIGAGKMATAIAKNISSKGPKKMFVLSRTFANASALASATGGEAVGPDGMDRALMVSDAVITATSASHAILNETIVRRAIGDRTSKLLIIDVSVPRNTDDDIRNISNTELETMEGLRALALENVQRRMSEIGKAERMIDEEMERIGAEMRERRASEVIKGINKKVAAISAEELAKAKVRARSSDIDDVFDDFSRALISRILADTYKTLKEASRNGNADVCDTAAELFRLEAGR